VRSSATTVKRVAVHARGNLVEVSLRGQCHAVAVGGDLTLVEFLGGKTSPRRLTEFLAANARLVLGLRGVAHRGGVRCCRSLTRDSGGDECGRLILSLGGDEAVDSVGVVLHSPMRAVRVALRTGQTLLGGVLL
jgi:hypothetical protein